ncbi:hypothetical protein AB4259_15255 [Vibrio amylolyticus]|uniref:hypothetical protein n=1 Tax=Vibrio amylolyticus TaxID=2847292 RepID=UPI003554354C
MLKIGFLAGALIVLQGCIVTSLDHAAKREFTNKTFDVRTDQSRPGATFVREGELSFQNLSPELKDRYKHDLEFSPYARTKINAVSTDFIGIQGGNGHEMQEGETISSETRIIEHEFSKYTDQDRVQLDAGHVYIGYQCTNINVTRILDDRPFQKTGTIQGKVEDGKCYQVITKMDDAYMGFQVRNDLGSKSALFAPNEIDWWAQCRKYVEIEEVACSTINQ